MTVLLHQMNSLFIQTRNTVLQWAFKLNSALAKADVLFVRSEISDQCCSCVIPFLLYFWDHLMKATKSSADMADLLNCKVVI
jgi:hypothetical protein